MGSQCWSQAFARIGFERSHTPLRIALEQCQESFGFIIEQCAMKGEV
jgi:hypothetical protein